MRREPRLGHQCLHPAQAGRVGGDREGVQEALGRVRAALQFDPEHTPEPVQDPLRILMVGMRRQPRIVHRGELRLPAAPLRQGEHRGVLLLHAHRQGLHAPVDEPRRHRIEGLPPHLHQLPHFLDHRLGSRHRARDHVRVPVQILGRAVNHQVRAVLERPVVDGGRERRVHDQRHSLGLAELRDRLDVDHPQQRVGRRFDEDGARVLLERPLPGALLEGRDERHLDPEPAELLREQPVRAAVDPLAREQVIAGPEHREVGEGRRAHAARHEDRRLGAFQQGEAPGDLHLVRIVAVAGVEDFVGRADRVREGAALVQRSDDRGPVGPGFRVAVNGARGEAEPTLHRRLMRGSARERLPGWAPPGGAPGARGPARQPPPARPGRRACRPAPRAGRQGRAR